MLGRRIGQEHTQSPGVSLAKHLCAFVGHVAKGLADLQHVADLFAAYVSAAVEHIGYRALRHAGGLGNVLDGYHGTPRFHEEI